MSTRALSALLIGLIGLAVIPMWILPVFPTQDGPGHVYSAHVLERVLAGDPVYQRFYAAELQPNPNWVHGVLMLGFGRVLGFQSAERLLLSLAVIVFCFGFRRLSATPEHPVTPVSLLGPMFATGFTTWLGFGSYSLGLALVPWAWALSSRTDRRAFVGVGVLGVCAWFCHIVPAGLIAVGAVVHGAANALAAAGGSAQPRVPRFLRQLAPSLGAALPVAVLSLIWILRRPDAHGGGFDWWPASTRLESLATLRALPGWVGAQEHVAMATAGLLLVGSGMAWRRRLSTSRTGWVLSAAAIALYFSLPQGGPGFWYLSDRLGLYPWLALVPVAAAVRGSVATALSALVSTAFLLAGLLGAQALQPDLADARAIGRQIPPGSVAMSLDFSLEDRSSRFRPFLHVFGYTAAERGVVDASSHEAQTDHFQVRLKPMTGFPDVAQLVQPAQSLAVGRYAKTVAYVVTFDASDADVERLRAHYVELAHVGRSRLFGPFADRRR